MAELVTIVIVYQNSEPWLSLCLAALKKFKNSVPHKILLVENPCHDSSPRIADIFKDEYRRAFVQKIIINNPPIKGIGGCANHGYALGEAFKTINTPWTLFLDADCIVKEDEWLKTIMERKADIVGPRAWGFLKDLRMVHAHPCIMLFKTAVARAPYWNGDFNIWFRKHHPDVIKHEKWWDTCIAFTHFVGIRPDVKLVNLPMVDIGYIGFRYFQIANIAVHVVGGSNIQIRKKQNKLFIYERLRGIVT